MNTAISVTGFLQGVGQDPTDIVRGLQQFHMRLLDQGDVWIYSRRAPAGAFLTLCILINCVVPTITRASSMDILILRRFALRACKPTPQTL